MRKSLILTAAAALLVVGTAAAVYATTRPDTPTAVVNGTTVAAPDDRCVREGDETPAQLQWRRTGRVVVLLDGTPTTLTAADVGRLITSGTAHTVTGVWVCPPA